ncbi:hypothetical protein DV515_00004214 [Chloebia gouldiae]|uniref:Uncharacterized protein n=1 Tax=Chloebia gouldiae TaxID=44316 RepID=A0A3L8SS55_CHLGU|nr:hypothetical protein DV515_00004214 [Chloebia gouldiae]
MASGQKRPLGQFESKHQIKVIAILLMRQAGKQTGPAGRRERRDPELITAQTLCHKQSRAERGRFLLNLEAPDTPGLCERVPSRLHAPSHSHVCWVSWELTTSRGALCDFVTSGFKYQLAGSVVEREEGGREVLPKKSDVSILTQPMATAVEREARSKELESPQVPQRSYPRDPGIAMGFSNTSVMSPPKRTEIMTHFLSTKPSLGEQINLICMDAMLQQTSHLRESSQRELQSTGDEFQ